MSYKKKIPHESTYIRFLTDRYDAYVETKKELLNNRKIIEYMYNKPIIKTKTLASLIIDDDSSVKTVLLDEQDFNYIRGHFDTLSLLLQAFTEQHDKYIKHYHLKNNFKYLPKYSALKPKLKEIMQILGKYEQANKLFYIYKWSFLQEGSHNSIMKLPTVNYTHDFIYDFFGTFYNKHRLILFVIQYDDDIHFNQSGKTFSKIHINDIMIQYILRQLNIHLIRLSKKSNFSNQIVSFFKRIIKTTDYVVQNPINPIANFFPPIDSQRLLNFSVDYKYNHIIYLKRLSKKQEPEDNYQGQIDKDFYLDHDPDEGVVMDNKDVQDILAEKRRFSSAKT